MTLCWWWSQQQWVGHFSNFSLDLLNKQKKKRNFEIWLDSFQPHFRHNIRNQMHASVCDCVTLSKGLLHVPSHAHERVLRSVSRGRAGRVRVDRCGDRPANGVAGGRARRARTLSLQHTHAVLNVKLVPLCWHCQQRNPCCNAKSGSKDFLSRQIFHEQCHK